jgi:hypothetical protein
LTYSAVVAVLELEGKWAASLFGPRNDVRSPEANAIGKKKYQTLLEKLRFDEDLKVYECEHPLDGKPIGIFIEVAEGCEPGTLEKLVDSTEAVLLKWPTLQKTILKAAREELVSSGNLASGDESKVTLASLVPFSFHATDEPDEDAYFRFAVNTPGILPENHHFDYIAGFAGEFVTTEIVHLM